MVSVLVKYCHFDGRRCYNSSCDYITSMGDVLLCSRHCNPFGRFTPRKCVLRVVNRVVFSGKNFVRSVVR